MMRRCWFAFLFLCAAAICAGASKYAGAKACTECHRGIAASQATTAMANTWRGILAPSLPKHFDLKVTERPSPAVRYELRRVGAEPAGDKNRASAPLTFQFLVTAPHGAKLSLPVQVVMGGKRHGYSFLPAIDAVDGIPLARRALIEARYIYSPEGTLKISPGFPSGKPTDLEDMLGVVLSPSFQKRCLICHGQPGTLGAGKIGGVRCETCHGPSLAHVASFTPGHVNPRAALPKKLTRKNVMAVCAPCHTGLSTAVHADPLPDDMLVSDQVPALRHSQCYIQSDGNIVCTDCHNPHRDSPHVVEAAVATCLRCHSDTVPKHAAICPVNATADCIRCHMPSVTSKSFRLTDHWIRVHPEQGIHGTARISRFGSLVAPRREFLRIIVVADRAKADTALQSLKKGDPFRRVARNLSVDPSAPSGGYIGSMKLSAMDPKLAAAAALLPYGGTSGAVDLGNRYVILHHLSRDFKWKANQLFEQAVSLQKHGELKAAAMKAQQALRIYPYFLRALVLLARIAGEAGGAQQASKVLSLAVQLYPKDAPAEFDLALMLKKEPAEQIAAFRRVIELDPDLLGAYQSLGAALYSAGQPQNAIATFRQGLQIDPLSAIIEYDLSLALKQQRDRRGATRARSLAAKLNPEIGSHYEHAAAGEKTIH